MTVQGVERNPLYDRIICDPPREKVPFGAKLNFSIWCRKVNLRVLCQKTFFCAKPL